MSSWFINDDGVLDISTSDTGDGVTTLLAGPTMHDGKDLGGLTLTMEYNEGKYGEIKGEASVNLFHRQLEAFKNFVADDIVKAKDGAYHERNMLVAALSRLFPASLERHPDDDKDWDDDWRWIVFIQLPCGISQGGFGNKTITKVASWHIHDSELPLFDHLPRQDGRFAWDGHTTEEKYERLKLIDDSHGCAVCGDYR